MTQITVKQMAAVKRTAMNVLPLTNKKAKLQAKIAEMNAEIEALNTQIDAQQGYVKSFAAGLTTEQLVVRNENKVFEPNTNVVYFDEEKRVYVVKETEVPECAPTYGSDFDADKEAAEAVAPTAEEIAAAEQARMEEEVYHQEQIEIEAEKQELEEAARLEMEAKEKEARIIAAKERLTAAKPQPTAEKEQEIDPFA